MAAVAPVVGLAATGISAIGSFTGGSKAAQGDQFEAQNAINAAQIGKTKAAETDTDMRRRLTSQLANINAIRAGAGLDPNSPTGAAISANVQGVGDLSRTQAVENIQQQVQSDQQAAQFFTSSASSALLGGEFGASGSIFSGLSGAMGGNNGLIGQGGKGLGGAFMGII
jgi:hypothetical protein